MFLMTVAGEVQRTRFIPRDFSNVKISRELNARSFLSKRGKWTWPGCQSVSSRDKNPHGSLPTMSRVLTFHFSFWVSERKAPRQ